MENNLYEEGHFQLTEQANWPEENFSNEGLTVGQIAGVATTTSGDVVIFHRGNRKWEANTFDLENRLNPFLAGTSIDDFTVLFLNEATGKIFRKWGKNTFYFPHGLSIDHEDNMWFTDVGMHQIKHEEECFVRYPVAKKWLKNEVFKFSRAGKLLLVLGEKFIPGGDHKHFCKPTDVAIETNGNFWVSDGYCNRRILKFSSKGELLKSIDDSFLSQIPTFPHPASLFIPHSTSLNHKDNILYVADRENGRVLAFETTTERYLDHYTGFGDKVFAVSYSPKQGGVLYVINGQSQSEPSIHGFTFDVKEKKIVQEWSPREAFIYPHDITCDPSGKFVYVSEITPRGKLWKFKLKQRRNNRT